MKLSPEDRRWLRKMVRDVLAEVIAQEASHGGYDGATEIVEDGWSEEGKKAKRKRIGFKP